MAAWVRTGPDRVGGGVFLSSRVKTSEEKKVKNKNMDVVRMIRKRIIFFIGGKSICICKCVLPLNKCIRNSGFLKSFSKRKNYFFFPGKIFRL
jgi:hypothetical protein